MDNSKPSKVPSCESKQELSDRIELPSCESKQELSDRIELPSCEYKQVLSDRIATFSVEKIPNIRFYFYELQHEFEADLGSEILLVATDAHLIAFDPTTEEDVGKIVMTSDSTCKLCCLDPVAAYIVKCPHILLPIITKIINLSLYHST